MIYWNRFISYIYRYHNNAKSENTGFAKVQKTSNTGKINIGLKDIMNRQDDVYSVYLYRETLADDEPQDDTRHGKEIQIMVPKPLYLGKLKMRGGRGEGVYSFDWNDVQGSGKPITAWSGIAIKRLNPDSSQYGRDMFCSSWTDSIVDYSYLLDEEKEEPALGYPDKEVLAKNTDILLGNKEVLPENTETDTLSENTETDTLSENTETDTLSEYLETESMTGENGMEIMEEEELDRLVEEVSAAYEAEAKSKASAPYANSIEEMLDTYERLPLLPESVQEGNQIIESVKITPNDIGLLDMNNWRLGVNSFLTHGFYNYKYLMLGKIAFQDNQRAGSYVLGVPGVYSAKEKYLAGIFGFDRFVPVKETEIKTGSFGYWLVNVTC